MPIDRDNLPSLYVAKRFCNIYGANWDGGAKRVLGGLEQGKPARQWNCESQDLNRYYLECEHGHRGEVTYICRHHVRQYGKDKNGVPQIQFCPRCNAKDDHRCNVYIREVS